MILVWEREQTSIQDRLRNEDKNIVVEQFIPEHFIYLKKAIKKKLGSIIFFF